MGIYQPQIILSNDDRELLRLLAQLLTDQPECHRTNIASDQVALSDRESLNLLNYLTAFSQSRKFVEGAFFVEAINKDLALEEESLREIYLSSRKRYGRTRAMASAHWREFLNRLGLTQFRGGYIQAQTETRARPMSYEHFRRMEEHLLRQHAVDQRVRNIILSVVDKYQTEVDDIRFEKRVLPKGSVSRLPNDIIKTLKDSGPVIESSCLSSAKVAGLMTVVADISVMFTTRDWSVAGTMSTIAGGIAATMVP